MPLGFLQLLDSHPVFAVGRPSPKSQCFLLTACLQPCPPVPCNPVISPQNNFFIAQYEPVSHTAPSPPKLTAFTPLHHTPSKNATCKRQQMRENRSTLESEYETARSSESMGNLRGEKNGSWIRKQLDAMISLNCYRTDELLGVSDHPNQEESNEYRKKKEKNKSATAT